jgi:hypothetical protein
MPHAVPSKRKSWSSATPMRPVLDPADWTTASLGSIESFSYHLTGNDQEALIQAIETARTASIPLDQITSENFSIQGPFSRVLRDMLEELRYGRGMAMLRGFPVDALDREAIAIGYLGIGSALGTRMVQNMQGHILGHVKDLGGDYADPTTRGYFTRAEMRIHSDPCDYVGLLCLQTAKTGGASCIASSVAIYNRMLIERPDLVQELVKDLYRSKKGDVNPGEKPWFKQPIFTFCDGYFSAIGVGSSIDKAQGLPGVPPFTDAQKEAVAYYRHVAEDSLVEIPFQRGDVQFLNNYVALHTRREYEDWPEAAKKRHLLRLWLNDPKNRPVPIEQRTGHHGQGLNPIGVPLHAPLDA